MNKKIQNYINGLFADIPPTKQAKELKEELTANLNERFNDYLQEGKTENQAYSLVLANMGDIDEILKDVLPTENFSINHEKYRRLKARNISFAIFLYCMFPWILIACSTQGNPLFGLLTAFASSSIATCILIYTQITIPKEYTSNISFHATPEQKQINTTNSLIDTIAFCIYLLIGFSFGIWFRSITIFIMAYAIKKIVALSYELKEEAYLYEK